MYSTNLRHELVNLSTEVKLKHCHGLKGEIVVGFGVHSLTLCQGKIDLSRNCFMSNPETRPDQTNKTINDCLGAECV